jgi:hypothetical protein
MVLSSYGLDNGFSIGFGRYDLCAAALYDTSSRGTTYNTSILILPPVRLLFDADVSILRAASVVLLLHIIVSVHCGQ